MAVYLGPAPVTGYALVRLANGAACANVETLVPVAWVHPVHKVFGESLASVGAVRAQQ